MGKRDFEYQMRYSKNVYIVDESLCPHENIYLHIRYITHCVSSQSLW